MFCICSVFICLPGGSEQIIDPKKPLLIVSPFVHEALFAQFPAGWSVVNKVREGDTCTMQLLPSGETPETMSKMVTIITKLGWQTQTNAEGFMKATAEQLRQNKDGAAVDFKIISNDNANDVMFEYYLKFPGGRKDNYLDQYEAQRILSGVDGIHVIVYHVPKATIDGKTRQGIIDFLRAIHLEPLPLKK